MRATATCRSSRASATGSASSSTTSSRTRSSSRPRAGGRGRARAPRRRGRRSRSPTPGSASPRTSASGSSSASSAPQAALERHIPGTGLGLYICEGDRRGPRRPHRGRSASGGGTTCAASSFRASRVPAPSSPRRVSPACGSGSRSRAPSRSARFRGVRRELPAQVADVELHLVARDAVGVAPHELEQLLAREHLVRVPHERREQPELERRQLDVAARRP